MRKASKLRTQANPAPFLQQLTASNQSSIKRNKFHPLLCLPPPAVPASALAAPEQKVCFVFKDIAATKKADKAEGARKGDWTRSPSRDKAKAQAAAPDGRIDKVACQTELLPWSHM